MWCNEEGSVKSVGCMAMRVGSNGLEVKHVGQKKKGERLNALAGQAQGGMSHT